MSCKTRVLFVVGPTACGKSEFAVAIAEGIAARSVVGRAVQMAPEIVNTDSVQFFAGVEIGAAKPTQDLLRRVNHHMIGHVPIGAKYTAGQFREEALSVIAQADKRAVNRILAVGGSGFYVQALEKGMYDVPEIPAETRERLELESVAPGGWEKLYRELKARDPQAAGKIQPADRYRILRALEILRTHTGTLTEVREKFASRTHVDQPFDTRKVGVFRDRTVLRDRVTQRTHRMLESGLIDEVVALRSELKRLAPDGALDAWAPLRSVGYAEVQEYLDGKLPKEQLASAIVTSTMQLARRQMTWFKRDASIQWFDAEGDWGAGCKAAMEHFDS